MNLADLAPCRFGRANAVVEAVLVWYFTEARAELEPPSNFGKMVAAIGERAEQATAKQDLSWHMVVPSGSQGLRARSEAVELDERLFRTLDREYPVRRALAAIGPFHADVLLHACWWPVASPLLCERLAAFGQRSVLAPVTRSARSAWLASESTRFFEEWLVRLSDRAMRQTGSTRAADRLLVAQIAGETNDLWNRSLAAFHEASSAWRSLVRAKAAAAHRASDGRLARVVAGYEG